MNRTNTSLKRSMGRSEPKRPKLDFSVKPSHPSSSASRQPINGFHSKQNDFGGTNCDTTNKIQTSISASDWDDDFTTDMLEKVCLIADLSQAMVNNEPNKGLEPLGDAIQRQGIKRTASERDFYDNNSKLFEELEKLRIENEKLKENVKTREGEVQILRSQLKQNQDAKQSEILNNIKIMEEMQTTFREKLDATQKEFDAAKTELQFKDLELKSLTERCKQLESNTTKVKLVEPQMSQLDNKRVLNSSQMPGKSKVVDQEPEVKVECVEEPISFETPIQMPHEGLKLRNLICPEYFNVIEEPSVIPYYTFQEGYGFHVSCLDFDKREKYKWSGYPKQKTFIKDTYNNISDLFLYDSFRERNAETIIDDIVNAVGRILSFQKDSLLFLEQLQEKNCEFDDSDCALLENEEEVSVVTLKRLLNGKKINQEECGIEPRRIIAIVVALMESSNSVVHMVMKKNDLLLLLKEIIVCISNLRRPTRYAGILAGIALMLSHFVQEKELEKNFVKLMSEMIEEIIFARPKLDVLLQVIEVLAIGRSHLDFIQNLCRRASVDSCALYMDSKLKQAMFFTKEACPLKLLCTQIVGLSCIPINKKIKRNVTRSIIKLLNRLMDTPFGHEIKWLPNNAALDDEDKCFDVMECLTHLLNACLKEYILVFDREENDGETKRNLLSIIGDGSVLFRRVLKSGPGLMQENSHNVRFMTLLKHSHVGNVLSAQHKEAVTWIVDLLESDVKNQEGCAKETTDRGIIDALSIYDDNLIIF